jgi:hypothetical protein
MRKRMQMQWLELLGLADSRESYKDYLILIDTSASQNKQYGSH